MVERSLSMREVPGRDRRERSRQAFPMRKTCLKSIGTSGLQVPSIGTSVPISSWGSRGYSIPIYPTGNVPGNVPVDLWLVFHFVCNDENHEFHITLSCPVPDLEELPNPYSTYVPSFLGQNYQTRNDIIIHMFYPYWQIMGNSPRNFFEIFIFRVVTQAV